MEQHEILAAAQRFIDLTATKKRLRDELRDVEREIDEMQEPLSDALLEAGLRNIKTERGETVYVAREVSVALNPIDGETQEEARRRVVNLLEDMGHENMVTYNHSSVRSLVRALVEDDAWEGTPLADVLRLSEVFKVRATGVQPAADA